MRIRQIKPAFWQDSAMSRLPAATRLFYIGLWGIADDAGYFEPNLQEIARDLYGYEPALAREKRVGAMLIELHAAGRIVPLGCGDHVVIPTFTEHQRLAGPTRQVKTILNDHLRRCVSDPVTPRGSPRDDAGRESPPAPADPRSGTVRNGTGNRNGTERQGTVNRAPARESDAAPRPADAGAASEFQNRVGPFASIVKDIPR